MPSSPVVDIDSCMDCLRQAATEDCQDASPVLHMGFRLSGTVPIPKIWLISASLMEWG